MKHPPLPSATPAGRDCLARLCLQHLEQEQAALETALAALGASRAALLRGETAGLIAGQQQAAAAVCGHLRQLRNDFRGTAAVILNLPTEDVTLSVLADALSGEAGRLVASARERLARLAAEVRRLIAANASLVRTSLDFVQRFLRDLTGAPTPSRYGPAGTIQEPACAPLLQARG
ncbi:MAG: flagellar export chaperone FlgN [Gemmataceae bacterium]|nr:flagellar export chaperone FlgN [Gemmataceae bacterium]